RPLLEDARREGPERLAVLDLEVHRRLHLLVAGVSDDAARAQRARAELHATGEPADHEASGHELRHAGEELGLLVVDGVLSAARVEHLLDLARLVLGPEQRSTLRVLAVGAPRAFEELVPGEERAPERAAGVARGGLDPDVVEGALALEL